jgi:hypothetical protein
LEKGITVLSLFDGISCGRLALERSNIKVNKYYASEIDKHAIKVALKNYPETVQLGSVLGVKGSELPKIDLLIGGSPCFVADTMVLTGKGYLPIQDIKVGDLVFTHTGNFRKVLRVGSRSGVKTRKIKGYGNLGIETTDEHPFYVRNLKSVWDNKNRTYKREFDNPSWQPASDLKIKKAYCSVVSSNVSEQERKTEIFWYMMGRYTGDGWYRHYKRKERNNSYQYAFIICCGKHEKDQLESKFKEFGFAYAIYEERTVYKFFIYSQELYNFVEKIGKGAANKIVHPDLWLSSRKEKKAYLEGLIDSDGTYHKKSNSFRITTVSKLLAMGCQQLITDVYGVPVRIDLTKKEEL